MREVQIVRWCDGDHAEPEPATIERTVVIDGGEAILIDLCPEHDKTLFGPVMELLEFGSPVRQPSQKTSTAGVSNRTCPICGQTMASRPGLSQHLRARHQSGLKAAKA